MPTRRRIIFEVDGERVVGDLHLPDGAGAHPGLVVAGPMTSVKEQVTGAYAAAMAMRGFAALAIDHRHFGESGGHPRQYERADRKIEDLKAALKALESQPEVVDGALGYLGVCLGCGYALWAAKDEPAAKAVGAVAGYYRDPSAMRAADPVGFQTKIDQGIAARRRYEDNGRVDIIPAAALEGDAAMTGPDTFDYYTRRAAHPNYRNEFAVMSREHFLPFDVQGSAKGMTAPLQMVHSERALKPEWARAYHAAVGGVGPIHWLGSKGQTDFYDDPVLVGEACETLAGHFDQHLR